MTEYKMPTMDDIKQVPTDVKIKGVIINVETKAWKDFIPADKLDKFDDPEELQIIITYEADGWTRNEKIKYSEKPLSTWKLGKFMYKYKSAPKVGLQIIIDFDGKGKSSIVIE